MFVGFYIRVQMLGIRGMLGGVVRVSRFGGVIVIVMLLVVILVLV